MSLPANRFAPTFFFAVIVLSVSMLTGASLTTGQEPAAPPASQQAAPPTDVHPEFPAGTGRDTTLAKCSKCHSANNILAMGRDRQGWQDLIVKMVDLGATGTDEEFSDILDYLTKSFPPTAVPHVNVNTATAVQIAATLTLTTDEAKQIVDYRDHNGKYKTLDDLKKVPNVDPKKIEAKKDAVPLLAAAPRPL